MCSASTRPNGISIQCKVHSLCVQLVDRSINHSTSESQNVGRNILVASIVFLCLFLLPRHNSRHHLKWTKTKKLNEIDLTLIASLKTNWTWTFRLYKNITEFKQKFSVDAVYCVAIRSCDHWVVVLYSAQDIYYIDCGHHCSGCREHERRLRIACVSLHFGSTN